MAGKVVRNAGGILGRFVDERQVLFKEVLEEYTVGRRPLLILAFDESQGLTDVPEGRSWSLYSELRRCLSETVGLPIFILFLSTAGKFPSLLTAKIAGLLLPRTRRQQGATLNDRDWFWPVRVRRGRRRDYVGPGCRGRLDLPLGPSIVRASSPCIPVEDLYLTTE